MVRYFWSTEQFYYDTVRGKSKTLIKYHSPVEDQKQAIIRHLYDGKNNDKRHNKENYKFQSQMIHVMSTQYASNLEQ